MRLRICLVVATLSNAFTSSFKEFDPVSQFAGGL